MELIAAVLCTRLWALAPAYVTTARSMPRAGNPSDPHPVVILAGGLGTRIRHLTPDLPKALVRVLGEPFAFHQLRLLASQGVQNVVFVIGYRGAQIQDAIGDGAAFDLRVSYVDEGEQLRGTGGALRFALTSDALPRVFGVLYGDSYLPIDLTRVWEAFAIRDRPALMTVYRNEGRWDASNVVVTDGLVAHYEKSRDTPDHRIAWIDYGFSMLERDVVERIPASRPADLSDLYTEMSIRGELAAYEVSERFFEVGTSTGRADLERHLAGRPSG